MAQMQRTTIIDIMHAVEAKKKVYHHHPRRRRFIKLGALGALLAVAVPLALSLTLISGGIGKLLYDHSLNPYINIQNEVHGYYATAEYPTTVLQDNEAIMAKTRALGNQYQVFLFAQNTQITTRDNPQYATAIYDIYIESNGRHIGSHKLAVTLSIMGDGRHWRITSINRPTSSH